LGTGEERDGAIASYIWRVLLLALEKGASGWEVNIGKSEIV